MIQLLEKLKLNTWYDMVLLIGIIAVSTAYYFEKDFIEEKHVLGFGIGLIIVAISMKMSEKEVTKIKPPNAYTGGAALITWKENRHNLFSILLLIVGIGTTILFGFYLIDGLL